MKIKAFDTAIVFSDTLTIAGAPVDLTSSSVKFLMKAGTTAFSATATIVSAADGTVKYLPTAGFPTEVKEYRQESEVTFQDTTKLTFPSDNYNKVTVISDLNGQ